MGATRWDGGECFDCGVSRGLLVVWVWRPPRVVVMMRGHEHTYPALLRARAWCLDQSACAARLAKRTARAQVRSSCIVLEEPSAPNAPRGSCRWCGEELTGENASRRNYCRKDREGRDCVGAWNRSRAFTARDAVRWRDLREHGEIRCAGCGVVCESKVPDSAGLHCAVGWEADHELALEDGGEHTLENLRARCDTCHRRKTGEENRVRAAARREAAAVERGYDPQVQLAIEG